MHIITRSKPLYFRSKRGNSISIANVLNYGI